MLVVIGSATPLVALWAAFQNSDPTAPTALIEYATIAVHAALGVPLVLISVINALVWSYWTLAYLRLQQ